MSAADPLLQPFQLRHLTLKNRVMSTAHAPSYVEDGLPQLRYQLYHEEKAKGGLALTMFGGSSTVAKDSPIVVRPDRHLGRPHHPGAADLCGPHPPAWLRAHDSAHARRATDALGYRRLAAQRFLLTDPGISAPFGSQGDGAGGHPTRAPAVWRCCLARQGRRAGRARGSLLIPSAGPVLVADHEPSVRRLRRRSREPGPLHPGDVRGDPPPGRARLHCRHPHVGQRDAGGRPRARGKSRDRGPPCRERADRFRQRGWGRCDDRSRDRKDDPDHGAANGALHRARPRDPRRDRDCPCSTPRESPTRARPGTCWNRAVPTWWA